MCVTPTFTSMHISLFIVIKNSMIKMIKHFVAICSRMIYVFAFCQPAGWYFHKISQTNKILITRFEEKLDPWIQASRHLLFARNFFSSRKQQKLAANDRNFRKNDEKWLKLPQNWWNMTEILTFSQAQFIRSQALEFLLGPAQ